MAGTPQRLAATDIFCRSAIIEVVVGNVGDIYIADSENKAITSNRHVLSKKGGSLMLRTDEYGNLESFINLKDIWFNGSTAGDKIIVSYMSLQEQIV